MMFSRTSRRTNPSFNQSAQQINNQQQIRVQQPTNIFMLPMRLTEPKPVEEPEPVKTIRRPSTLPNLSEPPRMAWGKPTWYFLHCLTYKIKPEHFDAMKDEILGTIYSICSGLPCPYCAEHAKEYLSRINFKAIQTKDEMIDLMYMFHNSVNKRKGYKLLSRNDLDQVYLPMNIVHVFNEFMRHFDKKNSSKLVHDTLFRTRQAQTIKIWFQSKLNCFDQ